MVSYGVYILSRMFFEFFLMFFELFRTMLAQKFQINGVKITKKCICESKS